MIKNVAKLMIFSIFTACSTTSNAAVFSLPDAPSAPKIEHPEKLDSADKRALADFYRSYAIYKDKIAAWKKRFK